VQTVYQIREGKLIGIDNKDRFMGLLPSSNGRYFTRGMAENNTDPVSLSREQNMYLLVVTFTPKYREGNGFNCSL
jgi:hypothetical protein